MLVFRGLPRVSVLRGRPGLYWSSRRGVALIYATTEETNGRRWTPGCEDVVIVGETDLPEVGVVVVGHDVRVLDVVRTPSLGGHEVRRARLIHELDRRGWR